MIHHQYDSAGRLITTTDNGRTLSYQYADKINRTSVQWPDLYYADYAYDVMNRIDTIKENGATTLATYAYDTSGRRSSITLGNGTITSYSYHDDDALNTLAHNVTGAADDVDWTYGFNKINQLTSKIMGGGANLTFYQWEPQYKKTDAYTSNGLNQYSAVAGASITYDASGNLTSDGVWNYVPSNHFVISGLRGLTPRHWREGPARCGEHVAQCFETGQVGQLYLRSARAEVGQDSGYYSHQLPS